LGSSQLRNVYFWTRKLAARRAQSLPLDWIASLDIRDAELSQHVDYSLSADHRDGQDVCDYAAEGEADRRGAQGVDEDVVPLVSIANASDQRGELRLHQGQSC